MRKHIMLAIAGALVGLPAFAQFTSVDPVQAGHATIQIGHEITMIGQGTQVLGNTLKILTTAIQTYSLVDYERTALTNRYGWMSLSGILLNDAAANRFGELDKWAPALNGNIKQINAAYQVATVAMMNPVWVKGTWQGNHMAGLASIGALDSAIQNSMANLSAARSNRQQNASALSLLQMQTLSVNPLFNTQKAQQNITNGIGIQNATATQHLADSIDTMSGIQLVQAKAQRDGQVGLLNTYTSFDMEVNGGTASFRTSKPNPLNPNGPY